MCERVCVLVRVLMPMCARACGCVVSCVLCALRVVCVVCVCNLHSVNDVHRARIVLLRCRAMRGVSLRACVRMCL